MKSKLLSLLMLPAGVIAGLVILSVVVVFYIPYVIYRDLTEEKPLTHDRFLG